MASVQDAIAAYLVTLGYGTLSSTIFSDWNPPNIANVIVVSGYGGSQPERALGQKGPVLKHVNIQVLVRNTVGETALASILAISDALDGTTGITSAGQAIILIKDKQGGPNYLGKDKNNWVSYSSNFEVMV
jgi:hypothetical protein